MRYLWPRTQSSSKQRADDFSPVKNAKGVDSPQSSKEDQLRMFARWLKAAGEGIETDGSGLPRIKFEISPRFAVDEADFVSQWATLDPKTEIKDGASDPMKIPFGFAIFLNSYNFLIPLMSLIEKLNPPRPLALFFRARPLILRNGQCRLPCQSGWAQY